jgi:hypothetical protein
MQSAGIFNAGRLSWELSRQFDAEPSLRGALATKQSSLSTTGAGGFWIASLSLAMT